MRQKTTYESEAKNGKMKNTGIKEICIWNNVKGYHVCSNFGADIQHDYAEGICNYTMTNVVNHCISKKYFTLDTLNFKIKSFSYGRKERANIPPGISSTNLKNKLRMSSSEMICFCRYFGLIMGDSVPKDDEFRKLYVKLCRIMDIAFSPKLLQGHDILLDTLVTEFNYLYIHLIGPLKPKMHLSTHYGRIIKLCGPLIYFWSMRNESKHRQLKLIIRALAGFNNVIKPLAIKLQLVAYNQTVTANMDFMICGPKANDGFQKTYLLIRTCPEKDSIFFSWIKIDGIEYHLETIVVIKLNDLGDPVFGKIFAIMKVEDRINFCVTPFHTYCFDEHVHAFEVKELKNQSFIISYDDLPTKESCLLIQKKNLYYIASRTLI